jgi:hypothetical protein
MVTISVEEGNEFLKVITINVIWESCYSVNEPLGKPYVVDFKVKQYTLHLVVFDSLAVLFNLVVSPAHLLREGIDKVPNSALDSEALSVPLLKVFHVKGNHC